MRCQSESQSEHEAPLDNQLWLIKYWPFGTMAYTIFLWNTQFNLLGFFMPFPLVNNYAFKL